VLEGALILLAGIVIGMVLRSLPARRKGPKPVEAVCGCKHHHSMHDPTTGECNASVPVDKYTKSGHWVGHDYKPCACLRYSGPEPLGVVFAHEIATDEGESRA
jgi:hypothetical protein